MLRAAIIGLGDVSPVHKYAIDVSDNGELVAVCDVNEALKTKYPEITRGRKRRSCDGGKRLGGMASA